MGKILAETHFLIADKVSDDLEVGTQINKKFFVLGSMMADYHPKYKRLPHYYDNSIEEVIKKLGAIIVVGRYLPTLTRVFSFELGVISHYLMDYCCKVHYENNRCHSVMGIKNHLAYEKALHTYAIKEGVTQKHYTTTTKTPETTYREHMRSCIDGILERYSTEEGFGNDLDKAYEMTYRIISFVLQEIAETPEIEEQIELLTKRRTLKLVAGII